MQVHALSLLLLLLAGGPQAEPAAGQIAGSIHDQTGAPLPHATISIRGAATLDASTGEDGRFALGGLPPGGYEVRASATGFDTALRTVHLQSGATFTLSIRLSLALSEDLVVTASKSGDADLGSMPAAITAVTGEELARLATHTIEQTVTLAPSVTFTQNSTFGQLSIRGIGTNLVNAGGDPSSAMYVDGVYLARPAMAFTDLFDLERIEVLRGPQGTLYGRNAVGGALNLISKAPTSQVDGTVRLTAGTFGEWRADARLSGPLKRDRILGSIALARGVRDGYVRDLDHRDHPLGGDDLTAVRGQLQVIVNPKTDLLLSSDVSDQQGIPLTYNKVLQVKPGVSVDNPAGPRDVRTSTSASSRILHSGGSLRFTTVLAPSVRLVSLTALRNLRNEFTVDGDVTELALLAVDNRETQQQWSEELTLTHRRSRLTSIAGTFLFGESDRQTIEASQPQAGIQVVLAPRVTARSAAVFGQTNVEVTSRLSGTFGLRYTSERKAIDNTGGGYALAPPMAAVPGSEYAFSDTVEYGAWTPKFGVELKLPPRVMVYASASKGFKSGGFNPSSTEPGRGFAPESAWSYEAGAKTQTANGRVRMNVAAFRMDYTNLQVQTPIGIGVFDIRNAAAATIRGVEIEGTGRIGRGFDAGGHLAWLDAVYDRYIAVALGGVAGDVAGHRLNNAPEWAGRLWAEWSGNIAGPNRLVLTLDGTAQSTVFFTPFNDSIQRQVPYALVGARIEYGPAHRRWAINAYARNLTATSYVMATFATSPAAYGGRPGAPRQGGLQLVLRR